MELPAGWVWAELGELANSVKNGIYVSRPGAVPNGVPILRISAVRPMALDTSDLRYTGMTREEVRGKGGLLEAGDLLFTRYNGNPRLVGACARVSDGLGDLSYPDKLIRVSVSPSYVDSRYICYAWAWSDTRRQVRQHVKTTAGQAGIAGSSLKKIRIPLPPLAEQRRIVEALEGHLSRLDEAEDGIWRAMRRAGSLKRRFLADATDVEGEMSKDATLGEVSQSVKNGIFVSRPGLEPLGVPILRIGSVRPLKLDASDVRYTGLSAESDALCGALLSEGDILFTRYNGNPDYVGACAVVPAALNDLTYPDKLIRVVVDRSQALPEYVALVCSAGAARDHIRRRVKTTAGQVGISGKEIKAIPFSLPDLEEQAARVQRYREASSAVETLQDVTRRSQVRGRHLRGAILRRAFEGELVPQDPADEPASALLARIQADRDAQPKAKRARRTPAAPRKAKTPAPAPAPTHAVQQEFDL
ncbi:restriction endonuclease subunit S [Streptomyces sp. NPDC002932]|uniref:restriction endonuclease subunit S n=1 Tax=Streptomyces sp. NPDC002932 TaxID=3364672 RepID=UPI0036878A61